MSLNNILYSSATQLYLPTFFVDFHDSYFHFLSDREEIHRAFYISIGYLWDVDESIIFESDIDKCSECYDITHHSIDDITFAEMCVWFF